MDFTNALNNGILLGLIRQNVKKTVSVSFFKVGGGEELKRGEACRKA